jgi:hypothetical protein
MVFTLYQSNPKKARTKLSDYNLARYPKYNTHTSLEAWFSSGFVHELAARLSGVFNLIWDISPHLRMLKPY